MNVLHIDQAWFAERIAAVMGCEPSIDYQTKEQRTDRNTGLPQWSVFLAMRADEGRRPEMVEISVTSRTKPEIDSAQIPTFKDLRVLSWKNAKGAGTMLLADGVAAPAAAGRKG